MTTTRPSTEPAVVFKLTGDTVIFTTDGLRLSKDINTSSTASTNSASLADVAAASADGKAGALTAPGRFFPGKLELGNGLPPARVMPSSEPAAKVLVELLAATADNPQFYSSAESFTTTLMPWVVQHMANNAGISVLGVASDVAKPVVPYAPAATGEPVSAEAIAPFAAFDVETANGDSGSIIQLGVAIVRDGEVAERYSWRCRPPKGLEFFDEANVAIHGITAADVATEPAFTDQLEKFVAAVGELDIVAHNARFDFTALARACRAEGIAPPKLRFACTYMWARQMQLGLANLKLPTLVAAAGGSLENHHDATADAVACAELALWLMKQQHATSVEDLSRKLTLSMGRIGSGRLQLVRYAPPAAPNADGTASAAGSDSAVRGQSGQLRGARGQGSRPRRNAKWDAAKTPDTIPEPNPHADSSGLLYGQRVTLTGDFAPYDKGFLWEKIADAGANINKGVTKKTTILVAGPWDSVTSKEKRARQLQEEGQEIQIWSEKELFTALGLDPMADAQKEGAREAVAGDTGDSDAGQPSALFGSTVLPGDSGEPPF